MGEERHEFLSMKKEPAVYTEVSMLRSLVRPIRATLYSSGAIEWEKRVDLKQMSRNLYFYLDWKAYIRIMQ